MMNYNSKYYSLIYVVETRLKIYPSKDGTPVPIPPWISIAAFNSDVVAFSYAKYALIKSPALNYRVLKRTAEGNYKEILQ